MTDASVSDTTFRDAICVVGSQPYSPHVVNADAILDMPEMQAIKTHLAFREERDCCLECHREWLLEYSGLPESVIEWVLS